MDFVYVHVWVCTHHSMRVEGVGSFLLPHGSSGLNTGHRGWLAPSVLTITTLPAPAELVCACEVRSGSIPLFVYGAFSLASFIYWNIVVCFWSLIEDTLVSALFHGSGVRLCLYLHWLLGLLELCPLFWKKSVLSPALSSLQIALAT